MHKEIEPAILYMGTPVVLITTLNEDGSVNVSPMSSAWWLGWSCMLGLDQSSKTTENLVRTGECVLNLPDASGVAHVDRLARKTASDPMPAHKQAMRWHTEKDKLTLAQLTTDASLDVAPPRIRECPIQLEATLVNHYPFAEGDPRMAIAMTASEVRISRVHAEHSLLAKDFHDRISAEHWDPLIMKFLQYYGHADALGHSRLAEVPEEAWGGRKPVPR